MLPASVTTTSESVEISVLETSTTPAATMAYESSSSPSPTTPAPVPAPAPTPTPAPLPPSPSSPLILEGSLKGWLAVLGSMLLHCFVFAPTEFIFGVFVLHYQNVFPNSTASAIAFVGTTGSAITYIAGFLSGMVADRFGFRPTAF
ncbi:hypothetical protein EDD21DRAFT_418801, partial [Dissophora ornata]